jgi:hypothetical protein
MWEVIFDLAVLIIGGACWYHLATISVAIRKARGEIAKLKSSN